jgi:DNA-binding MarR family transcriptional regulator
MARSMVADLQATKVGVIDDLRATFGELKCIGSERLVRQGISMSQLHVLNLLDRHGEMAMSHLADMLDVSMSAASGLVDRIEERGYVERIRVPSDRRVVIARVTDSGRRVLDDVDSVQTEMLSHILDHVDDARLTRLAAAMADLRTAVDATVTDHGAGAYHIHQPQGRK